ncbi:hypothetical protein Nepgr_009426 [Nepenthes gracilis]|uniref:Uncharacterized protein n=1 Tax=Nepenthes gracilis TaxID=150966 RepID=A0AAD3SAV1_NEPGR|nr:hypothetical protein Nepgr_009426 [Nepenthes gracilis]
MKCLMEVGNFYLDVEIDDIRCGTYRRTMLAMKKLKKMIWGGECGRTESNLRGSRKDRSLQHNKLLISKSQSKLPTKL